MTLIGVGKVAAKGIGPGSAQQGAGGHQCRACDELDVLTCRLADTGRIFAVTGGLTARFQGAS